MNMIIVTGTVVGEPRLDKTLGGRPVCNFEIQENDNANQRHRIAIFGESAEAAACQLGQGCAVWIEGKLKRRFRTDLNVEAVDIVCRNFVILGAAATKDCCQPIDIAEGRP